MERIVSTNCIVYQPPRILLGLKKRGFAEGRWNGFGGKVHAGEDLTAAALRELEEECGIVALDPEFVGKIEFIYLNDNKLIEVNFFRITKFRGEPIETEEMRPQWFHISEIPYKQMWPDDEYFLPLFLANKQFNGRFIYEDYDRIIQHVLEEI